MAAVSMKAGSMRSDCRSDCASECRPDNTVLNFIALIPAYEPDEKLISVINELTRAGFETVVVDDGSGPEYRDIFREAEGRAAVISYDRNMGKGAALKTGLAYIYNYRCGNARLSHESGNCHCEGGGTLANTDGSTIIVTVDADGQHKAKDVLRVARTAAKYPGTLVLGSRDLSSVTRASDKWTVADSGSGSETFRNGASGSEAFAGGTSENRQDSSRTAGVRIPLRSRFGNTVTGHVFRLATGVPVGDTQTGLRAFSADLIPKMLEIRGKRYEYEINMLLDFAADNIPIREERIETVYIDNNSSSHFNAVKDSFRIYKEILKFSASSLIGFVTDYIVFALLTLLTPHVAAANIGARIVSSITNYTINRKFVFGSRKSVSASALQYFALAALILAGNTIMLSTLAGSFGINTYAAKIITELVFFVISWTVQRYIIFYNEEGYEYSESHKGDREAASGEADNAGNVRFIVKRRAVRTPKLRAVVSADAPGSPEGRLE